MVGLNSLDQSGSDRWLIDHLSRKNQSIQVSDTLIAFGVGRTYDLCMDARYAEFDLFVDNSPHAAAAFLSRNTQRSNRVHSANMLLNIDLKTVVVVIFSAQGWDIEEELTRRGVPSDRFFNFVEIDEFQSVFRAIPRDVAFHGLADIVSPSDVCIDVGANEGHYAIRLAELVSPGGGKVFAVEPSKKTREALARNIRAAGCSSLIRVLPFALGDGSSRGSGTLSTPRLGDIVKGGSARLASWSHLKEEVATGFRLTPDDPDFLSNDSLSFGESAVMTEIVKLSHLDELFEEEQSIDFIKIDVEGADLDVLRGGKAILSRHRPKIVIEAEAGSSNLQMIERFLEGFEYSRIPWSSLQSLRRIEGGLTTDLHDNHLFVS
jgi:FkbM family methyltransferase